MRISDWSSDVCSSDLCTLFDRDAELFAFVLISQHGQLRRLEDGMPNPVASLRGMFQAAIDAGECRASDADIMTAMALGLVIQHATFMIYGRLQPQMRRMQPALAEAAKRVLLP